MIIGWDHRTIAKMDLIEKIMIFSLSPHSFSMQGVFCEQEIIVRRIKS